LFQKLFLLLNPSVLKNLFLILSAAIFFTTLYSCNNETKVAEESKLISYDPEMLKQIESDYDSSFVENLDRSDYASISHYIVDSINENLVFRDSMQRVVAIVKRERGTNYFTAEYYPNGQLKAKISNSSPGMVEGPAIHYYENGVVSLEGQWKNLKRVGEWKQYNDSGQLVSVETYNEAGWLEKEELIDSLETSNG